jgi:ammonia channel protein AmtB
MNDKKMLNMSQATYNEVTEDDAGWILSNTFLILTMQTGFGMLEAGSVSFKNIANIMVKNCVDVTLGTVSFLFNKSTISGSHFKVGSSTG